ncbi:MAG TPA: hypothetical protein VII47_10025, partial [Actinomycetota bacterium]
MARARTVLVTGSAGAGHRAGEVGGPREVPIHCYDLRRATAADEAALGVRFQELDALLAET